MTGAGDRAVWATAADAKRKRNAASNLRMEHLRRCEGEGKHGDVVLLAELLCCFGDVVRGFSADGAGAVEAEELSCFGLRFDDAIGEEGERVSGGEVEAGLGILGIGED